MYYLSFWHYYFYVKFFEKGGNVPKHKVIMRQPKELVMNTDIEFVVRENGKKLGELHVSKGSIEWLPSNGRYKRRLRWSKFAELMSMERKVR
jgi:hypothetical protein